MHKTTCCLVSYSDIPDDKADNLRDELEREIDAALEDGYRRFLAEFTEGAGILFARCIQKRRVKYPLIYFEIVLSKLDQAERFNHDKWELLSKSSGIKGLCPECKANYPLSVTREFVEHASRVIAVRVGPGDSDTLYAMDYARTMERDLRIIEIRGDVL